MRRYGLLPWQMDDLTPREWSEIVEDFRQQNAA